MKTIVWAGALAGAAAVGAPAVGQFVPFRGMGDLPGGSFASRALGISVAGAGTVVVGDSMGTGGWRAFRWTPSGGMQNLGQLSVSDQFSLAAAVSPDGSVIVGSSGFAPSVYECQAFRWTAANGMQALGPFVAPIAVSLPHAVSQNGAVIVGEAGMTPGSPFGFRIDSAGIFPIGTLPGGEIDYSGAHGVSDNGAVIVGRARTAAFDTVAVRWTQAGGLVPLGFLNPSGFQDSRAYGCSADGAVVVGASTSISGPQEAFRWTAAGGMAGLGDLPGGAFRSEALAASEDGALVFGWSEGAEGNRAFMWDAEHGMRDLRQLLAGRGWNVSGWVLSRATGTRGGFVVGVGVNPAGQTEGWIANLGCYPDCNGDSTLTIGDFGCFQVKWLAQDPYADCSVDGVFTIGDFGCFQGAFVTALAGGCS